MNVIVLKPGREKSLIRRHPWIYSGSIDSKLSSQADEIIDGDTVKVLDAKRNFLGWGAYSSLSQIRVRIWSWDPERVIDRGFFNERLVAAITMRSERFGSQAGGERTNALRLVHAESDGLPGLVVDRYDDTLVVQILSRGTEYWRDTIIDLLIELTGVARVYERSDAAVRSLEGLTEQTGLLYGDPIPDPFVIKENSLKFKVDIAQGHKTGFYLDQRSNRAIVGAIAGGRQVLDCFAYSGGFSVYALQGGAESVLAIDSSTDAIRLLDENIKRNGFSRERIEIQQLDVFQALRLFRDQDRKFDLVVLDPPKFAPTAAHAQRAARGYKDINILAMKLLSPGGLLATFSCSGGVSAELFQKIIAGAAVDAGVDGKIIGRMTQDSDHPVALNFPEGAYLKGMIIRV